MRCWFFDNSFISMTLILDGLNNYMIQNMYTYIICGGYPSVVGLVAVISAPIQLFDDISAYMGSWTLKPIKCTCIMLCHPSN